MSESDGPILPMPKPYSRDCRERVVESVEAGGIAGPPNYMQLAEGDDLGA